MTSAHKNTWQYFLDGILLLGLAIPTSELLYLIPGSFLRREFFLLYFAAYFLAAFLFEILDHAGLTFRLLPAFPIAVGVISRDLPLFLNCLFALLLFAVFHFLLTLSIRKWLLLPLLAALLILWIPREDMPGYVAGCLILSFFALLSELVRTGHRSFLLLLGLAATIAFLIPSSEEPIQWEGLKNMISRVGNMLSTAWDNITFFFEGMGSDESTAYTGYSEAGGLAGSLGGNNREALHLTLSREQSVYLKGAVYARLTPEGFPEQLPADTPVNSWLALYLSALSGTDTTRDEVSCFTRSDRAEITYSYIRTSDLLIPATTFRIQNDLKYGLQEKEEKGFSYEFNFLAMDYASPYFRQFAEKAAQATGTADYAAAKEKAWELYNFHLSDYLSEAEYYAALNSLQESASDPAYLDTGMATDDIRELSERLTADCRTKLEKALKIEAFLRQYTYDTSTDLRGRENYIQSFLFEEQRGYCVHYASAMVLLLRLNGIPARYVQGFLCPANDTGVITGSDAHAWVEAWMEGYGWMRFEPTAAMPGTSDNSWGLVIRDRTQDPEVTEPEEEEIEPPEIPTPVITPDEIAEEKDEKTLKGVLLTIGLYLGTILAITLLILMGYILIRRIHYRRLPLDQKLMADMRTLRSRLDKKYGTKDSLPEYLPHIENDSLRNKMNELIRDYYRVRFRGDPTTPELVHRTREMSDLLVSRQGI